LTLALVAAPLRQWLDQRFRKIFAREAALYRDVVARVGEGAGKYKRLSDLLQFIEERTANALELKQVRFILNDGNVLLRVESDNDFPVDDDKNTDDARFSFGQDNGNAKIEATKHKSNSAVEKGGDDKWLQSVLAVSEQQGWQGIEDADVLRERGFRAAFPLRHEDRIAGLMLIDAMPDALTEETRAVLEVLAGQVAIAIEDSRLVQENVRLERRLAEGERLAALGQMAATVAHEVKNPLSAIKSIAQVMREDVDFQNQYARDIDLIVGETDRLSRSVTQLLSFARSVPPSGACARIDDIARVVVELFQAEANARGISLVCNPSAHEELDGTCASALRDALINLTLNALQATPRNGNVFVETGIKNVELIVSVTDGGSGVPSELRERVWEPFFTTKQRGTGLGLAIVRKRMIEAGGAARLAPQEAAGKGARFELVFPLPDSR
jgi:signal transduction histidine kinase